jgi:hypothetical protein
LAIARDLKLQETFNVKTLRSLKALSAAALLVAAGTFGALADDPAPTPAALASAHTIIVSSGITRSFDQIVPQMLEQLERSVTNTRPELKDTLHAVVLQIEPEFAKSEQQVIDAAAQSLAKRMSEQELKDAAAFFQSASGKKYVDSQPAAFGEIVAAVQAWRQKLSTDMMDRTRAEMKKKGVEM